MKHYSSWTEQQRGEFLDAYDDTEPRTEKRAAVLKRYKIDPKNQGAIVAWLKKMDKGNVEEQTALALADNKPAKPNGAHEEPAARDPRMRISNERRVQLAREYYALPKGSPERRKFLEDNRVQQWEMSQWAAAYGVRKPDLPKQPESETIDTSARRKFTQKAVNQRALTRKIPAEAKVAHVRAYLQLNARDGSRGRYLKANGLTTSSMSYWVQAYNEGIVPGSRNKEGKGIPLSTLSGGGDGDVEELAETAAPSKKSTKPSYADLMEQNLILKGLLKRAERMGFDVMKILSIGE